MIILDDTGVREPSPPWDIEEPVAGSSTIVVGQSEHPGDDVNGGPPPLSQLKAGSSTVVEGGPPEMGDQPVGGPDRKSTPSTLSDDAEDTTVLDIGPAKRQGRVGANTRKRLNSKGGDSEDRETSEEGQDAKRRPRKSARLA